jgi:crotonobetainyl-CoA:carnitine CoA-transferase CaiB-like acyl-CoA transferase
MSRKLRIEYPGAMYHVMNRGDQREDIFRDDQDRQKFLSTLGEACAKTDWHVGRGIERLGWDEDQLRARRKGHRSKVMLARRLRQEMTM